MGGVPGDVETLTAPPGQDMIITDVHFSNTDSQWLKIQMSLPSGPVAGFASDGTGDRTMVSLQSGIRIPAGQTLSMAFAGYYGLANSRYTVSGYYARP